MAPSRRKGASKAAAAAAARRQWKVGDLVLAKVKGFPAWPAMVSEPEKWGYSTDSKKVLVYFFGTQQIAFCNPADVEPFTEERKQSLVKRQGKGADFVRAVQEIIDSYENLNKETHIDEINSSGEISAANVSNPVDSLGSKDQTEALELTHNSQMKLSNSVTDKNGLRCTVDNASGRDESSDKEASFEEPSDSAAATVKSSLPVTYSSRKRSVGLHLLGYVTQRNAPVRRSRGSSRVQNFVMPCSDGRKSTGNLSTKAVQNVSVRRNKHIRKSPDLSDSDDIDSSGLASNGSMEDNGSDSLTIDSDAFSPGEGSTIDSISKPEHSETIECLEDVELNKGLDIKIKAVVNKRKRKPNRKWATSDAAKLTVKREEAIVQHASQSLQNMCANLKERQSEQDGDEHLPLLKRARVRKLSSTEAEFNSIGDTEEKSSKEEMKSPQQVNASSNCENGSPTDGDLTALNAVLDNVSPSKAIAPCSGSEVSKIKNDQIFGCSVDGEAALPPSKRLHRALEAMSANAAEGQACREASSALMASSGRCCISSIKRCPCAASNSPGGHDIELQGVDTCSSNDSAKFNVYCFSTSSYPMVSTENISLTEVDKHLIKFENHEICKDFIPGAREDSVEDHSDSLVCQVVGADSQIQLQGSLSPNLDRTWGEVESNQDPSGRLLPSNDKDNIRTVDCASNVCNTSEHDEISLDSVSDIKDCGIILPQYITDMAQNEVCVCEKTEDLKPPVGDSSKVNDMSEVMGEVKCKEQEEDVNSVSISDDCLGEKGILGLRSSPSLTDGGDCLPQGSPPNTSVCNVSTSDSSNVLQNNGSCSPDVHLHQKKTLSDPDVNEEKEEGSLATQQSRSMGKSAEAGHAALLYFEAMLGTLTRTKESIGRATRIAIDCAKFGIAAKVVEILVHSLESESSLHRRVDLFFLVDSISQCSRGLKGDVGEVYLSAIQAVLPRLLSAAVPLGNGHAQENHRQCLKVLRLWLERGILPESIVRHHIRELELHNGSASAGAFSRRTLRTERPLDDPVRDMEGMLVDEYGSNASFRLPGFCMPRMLKVEGDGSDSDGENFEAVTPEHKSETCESIHTIEKHRHILEDVDGELEMEDVAPSCDVEMNSFFIVNGEEAASVSHNQLEKNLPLISGPPLLQDMLLSSPPPPSSPPPLPPPPPPSPLSHQSFCAASDSHASGVDSKLYKHEQAMQDNLLPSMVQPFVAPSSSQPISDVLHYRVPECRDVPMQIPAKSASSISTLPVPPLGNFCHSDGVTIHNKGYPLRPPQHAPSDQFSFVRREQHVEPWREIPPPAYPNRQHFFARNIERESLFNNHERLKPPPSEFRERWRVPATCPGPRYQDRGMPAPYGCHPSESTRFSGHGWRFPPHSMNHKNSMSFRPPFQDAIPVASRGPSFWGPR